LFWRTTVLYIIHLIQAQTMERTHLNTLLITDDQLIIQNKEDKMHKSAAFQLDVICKVKLCLCLTKHHTMNTYWGNGSIAPCILDLGIRWRWAIASRPGRFTPREGSLGTHWLGGWVGPRAVLDAVVMCRSKIYNFKIPAKKTKFYHCVVWMWGVLEQSTQENNWT
jgi:hypothetical protein